jgi:hypothetical protein
MIDAPIPMSEYLIFILILKGAGDPGKTQETKEHEASGYTLTQTIGKAAFPFFLTTTI